MMKKHLFILIMSAIWGNLSAQLKTYSGDYEYYDGSIRYFHYDPSGRAVYTYKESSDGERIYHGKFSFVSQDSNFSVTGNFIDNKKSGKWTYKNSSDPFFTLCTVTYSNGILDGKWEFIYYANIYRGKLTRETKQRIFHKEIRNYKQGKLHGVYKREEESGMSINATYNEGKLVGAFEYSQDDYKMTGNFDNQGYPTGTWIEKGYNSTSKHSFYKGICYKSIRINNQTGKIEYKEPENAPDDLLLSDTIVQAIRKGSRNIIIDGNKYHIKDFNKKLYYNIDNDSQFTSFKNCYQLETYKEPEPEKPYDAVEQMPTFPGGEAELMKFIRENLKYPLSAQKEGIQGRVILRFVVSKTGTIENITILRSLEPACDEEAIRLIKSMPRWIPGKQNGNAVPVYYTLPVVFKLIR